MTTWVIAGKPMGTVPEVGKTYEVRHSRKGTLTIKVQALKDEWVTGELISGKERLMSSESTPKEPGESITLRDVHCYLLERP